MDEVKRLIKQLKRGDEETRKYAASQLRGYTASQLGKIKAKRVLQALIKALKDESSDVRKRAVWALEKIGEPAVPALIKALKDEDGGVRREATRALGHICDASTVPALTEALEDKDWFVQSNARWALGEIGDARAVPALLRWLGSEEKYLNRRVIELSRKIIEKCKTVGDLEIVEKGIDEGLVALKRRRVCKDILIDVQIEIADLTREIAKKKDELTPKRDLLLGEKPKPPMKGRGVYQTLRKCRR